MTILIYDFFQAQDFVNVLIRNCVDFDFRFSDKTFFIITDNVYARLDKHVDIQTYINEMGWKWYEKSDINIGT